MHVNNYSHDQEPRRRETISVVTRYADSDIDSVTFSCDDFSLFLSLSVWFFALMGFPRPEEFSTLELANGNFSLVFFFLFSQISLVYVPLWVRKELE